MGAGYFQGDEFVVEQYFLRCLLYTSDAADEMSEV